MKLLAIIIMGLLAFPASAIIVIDDFNAGAYELGREGTAMPYTVSDEQTDPTGESIIGGHRHASLYKESGSGTQPYTNCMPGVEYMGETGVATYNSSFGCNAVLTLTYGYHEDLNVNLTGGENFEFNLISGDMDDSNPQRPVPLTITVTGGGVSFSVTQQLIAEGVYLFPFADFTGVDFADVDQIVLQLEQDSTVNDAVDFAWAYFQTDGGSVAAADESWSEVKASF